MVAPMLSSKLIQCMRNHSRLQLRYNKYEQEEYFSIPLYFHGMQGYYVFFDPWNGAELRCEYDSDKINNYRESMRSDKRLYRKRGDECYLHNYSYLKKKHDEFLNRFGPITSKKSRKCWDSEIKEGKEKHYSATGVCRTLSYFIDGGEEEGLTPIIHVPNIRTYAILNKKEYGGFEAMDFCPFCGAKFPKRLDGKLTEILQKDYGLKSWRDYKKAPHEFWTDEWWKKRGL